VPPWSAEQNKVLDSWSEVPTLKLYSLYEYLGNFEEDVLKSGGNPWNDNDFKDWTRVPSQGPPSQLIYNLL
jgi:hypothetical protein